MLVLALFVAGLLALGGVVATFAFGPPVLQGAVLIALGATGIWAREIFVPPTPAEYPKYGWASWSSSRRAEWRQWPRSMHVAGNVLGGVVAIAIGVAIVIAALV